MFKATQVVPKIKTGVSSKAFPIRGENVTNLGHKNIDNRLASPSKPDVLTLKVKKGLRDFI